MKIAVIGSRDFKDRNWVNKILMKELAGTDTSVISGGASGVDTWVKEFCDKECTECEVIRPLYKFGDKAPLYRNAEIIARADKVIAFWNGSSIGTKWTIDYAKARGKPVIIYKENVQTK